MNSEMEKAIETSRQLVRDGNHDMAKMIIEEANRREREKDLAIIHQTADQQMGRLFEKYKGDTKQVLADPMMKMLVRVVSQAGLSELCNDYFIKHRDAWTQKQ